MKITKKSILTGVTRTMDLPITEAQYAAYYAGADLIQRILPHLTIAQREFLMTGITDEEWAVAIGPDEGDEA
jgi:hypothetical protein